MIRIDGRRTRGARDQRGMVRAMVVAGALLSAVAVLAGAGTAAAEPFDHLHAGWTTVLRAYQAPDGRMSYGRLVIDVKAKPTHALTAYLAAIGQIDKATYDGWNPAERKAFLINAYNAHTVKFIADHYPVKSIKDLGSLFKSPWKQEILSLVGGAWKTLDAIEHEALRPQFKDARIHAAVNCASVSCPRLAATAFVPSELDRQLDEAMRVWLADPGRNRYDAAKGVLHLSKIFDWYGDDFKQSYGGVAAAVEKYGPAEAQAALKAGGRVEFLDYDWGLNDAGR